MEKKYRQVGEIRLKEPRKLVRHPLEILPDGLMVCTIKVVNPFNKHDEPIECKALIDTGADTSVICKSLFSRLKVDPEYLDKTGIHTASVDQENVTIYPLNVYIPKKNWYSFTVKTLIFELNQREGYQFIIGMDILRNFQLVYNGLQREAWLDSY